MGIPEPRDSRRDESTPPSVSEGGRQGGLPCTTPPKARSLGRLDPASAAACYTKEEPPTWKEWRDRDDTIDFNDYYGGNLDGLMMHAVTYVRVDRDVMVDMGTASDDSIQILLDGQEVHINNTARSSGGKNAVLDVAWRAVQALLDLAEKIKTRVKRWMG